MVCIRWLWSGEGVDNKWLNQVVFKDSNTMLTFEPSKKVNIGSSILDFLVPCRLTDLIQDIVVCRFSSECLDQSMHV